MLIISVLAVINSSLLFFCLFIFSQFAFALFEEIAMRNHVESRVVFIRDNSF